MNCVLGTLYRVDIVLERESILCQRMKKQKLSDLKVLNGIFASSH